MFLLPGHLPEHHMMTGHLPGQALSGKLSAFTPELYSGQSYLMVLESLRAEAAAKAKPAAPKRTAGSWAYTFILLCFVSLVFMVFCIILLCVWSRYSFSSRRRF